MSGPYAYTPYIWPMLASAVFMAALGLYAGRRRSVPGALPFAILLLFLMLWSFGAAMELAAVELATKIFWFKFQGVIKLPAATAELCFGLEYARLGRLLTRRNLALLSIPPLLVFILTLTNDAHHLLWLGFWFDGVLHPSRSSLTFTMAGYSYVLALAMCVVLIRLLARSPQYRWPVVLILSELLIARTAVLLDFTGTNPFAPMNPVVLVWNVGAVMYALALFGLRMFDPIPQAHKMVIEQMQDGLLVLDAENRIADVNPAALKLLGALRSQVVGRAAGQVLAGYPDLNELARGPAAQTEIWLNVGAEPRCYQVTSSPLTDPRGFALGRVIALHDITKVKRAQAQLMEQQRVVATLEERERLARELHDSLGQMLGYVSMQAQAIRKWVQEGQAATAEAQLTRLADAAQEAHADIRESIFSLKGGPAHEWSFLAALRQHLDSFRDHYGIRTELSVPVGLTDQAFEPVTRVQLLRVIQEAMTNARRHGRARCVRVAFECEDGQARIIVADDGRGFDPGQLSASEGDHLGLAFMRERMAQVGGRLTIQSRPGAGAQVMFQVPTVSSEQ